jgi:hypothetical protein
VGPLGGRRWAGGGSRGSWGGPAQAHYEVQVGSLTSTSGASEVGPSLAPQVLVSPPPLAGGGGFRRETRTSLAPEVLVELTSTSHRILLAPHELIVDLAPLASGRARAWKWVENRYIASLEVWKHFRYIPVILDDNKVHRARCFGRYIPMRGTAPMRYISPSTID